MPFDPARHPHRRFNPLTGEWLLVSPHRGRRPWQGKVEAAPDDRRPAYDPECYLCPGNTRAGGHVNPAYTGTFVFDNDFPALLSGAETPRDAGTIAGDERGLIRAAPEAGRCRVVCFSPRHDLTLPRLDGPALRGVVDAWVAETRALGALPEIGYVQVFENKGALMGCSNPHPHGQIWATASLPEQPGREHARQRAHFKAHGSTLLGDYLALEDADGSRMVCANEHFVCLVPYWAVWPFETLLAPRRPVGSLTDLADDERDGLADLLRRITCRYDNLFETSFPYSMGFHQRPTDGGEHPHWHLHAHFYPPLLRSATVRKFMVGFELLGTAQRDLTAEQAARRLRETPERHYLDRVRRTLA